MKVHLETQWQWNGTAYIKTFDHYYEYNGFVELACGASSGLKSIGQQQSNFFQQLQTQASTVMGASSNVFNQLMATFAPTIKAGPSQEGMSPAQLAAERSAAITGTGQQYKNAKAAVGNANSAYGGGNTVLPSGAQIGSDLGLAEAAANQTSSELLGITDKDYDIGRHNYEFATQGLANAPGVFNPATTAANAATGAGEAAASTQNQIQAASTSWMQPVFGALGAVAGAATGGLTSKLMSGAPKPTPQAPTVNPGVGSTYGSGMGDSANG